MQGTMKKIDFTKIEVQDIEGRTLKVDITKNLGNQLYMQGQNVEACAQQLLWCRQRSGLGKPQH